MWSGSDEPDARSICNGDTVIGKPDPLENMALLFGRGNAAAQQHTMTTELFVNRDRKKDIKHLKVIAPVGSTIALRINQRVRNQQLLFVNANGANYLFPVCAWYNCLNLRSKLHQTRPIRDRETLKAPAIHTQKI